MRPRDLGRRVLAATLGIVVIGLGGCDSFLYRTLAVTDVIAGGSDDPELVAYYPFDTDAADSLGNAPPFVAFVDPSLPSLGSAPTLVPAQTTGPNGDPVSAGRFENASINALLDVDSAPRGYAFWFKAEGGTETTGSNTVLPVLKLGADPPEGGGDPPGIFSAFEAENARVGLRLIEVDRIDIRRRWPTAGFNQGEGVWNHYGLVWDDAGFLSLFVNGRPGGTTDISFPFGAFEGPFAFALDVQDLSFDKFLDELYIFAEPPSISFMQSLYEDTQ